MSRAHTINKLKDVPQAIAIEIMDQIFPKASDAIAADQDFDTIFATAAEITPVHLALKESVPVTEQVKGVEVSYIYGHSQYYNIKQVVEDATAKADISDIETEVGKVFNITDADELADFLAAGKSVAAGALKKLCKLFSLRVHNEFSQKSVAVETIFNKAEFGLVGYFYINDDGSRGKSANINESRLALKIQNDSKALKKAGEKSDEITQDYDSVKGTQYETNLIAAIQPIIPQVESFGKQLAIFSKSFREIKTKTGAIRLEKVTKSKGTEAKAEKSTIAEEEGE